MSPFSPLPQDIHDIPAEGGYIPGAGVVAQQMAPASTDSSGVSSAPSLVEIITEAGYIAAYSSNAATTTAATDYTFKWGTNGTTQVYHVMVQNNTGANINWDLDIATTLGSPILPTGQTLFLDSEVTVLHLQTAAQQTVNGTTAGGIVVRGWL